MRMGGVELRDMCGLHKSSGVTHWFTFQNSHGKDRDLKRKA